MGYSILEFVLRRLRQANFTAAAAFPGQKFPKVDQTLAAVHIEKVDRANMTVTVEVSILCPGDMGGTACEMEALRATEVLRWTGAVCVQNGCTYDGIAQVYVVQVLATYTGVTEADDCTIWPGFYCYVNDVLHGHCVGIATERTNTARLSFSAGESGAKAVCAGADAWEVTMEEQIPGGSAEVEDPEGELTLTIETNLQTEVFTGCRWTSVKREFTRQGLHRISRGIARKREVTEK